MTVLIRAAEEFTATINVKGVSVRFFEGVATLDDDSPALPWLRARPNMRVTKLRSSR